MNPLDSYTLSLMQSIQNPLLTDLMLIITNLVSYAVLFLIFLYIIWRREKNLASAMLIGLLMEGLTVVGLKFLIRRPRPHGIIKGIGHSFPSGHSSRAGFLSLLFSRRWGLRALWYSLAGLVIFSRLYLRVHYATDVLGGLVIGSAIYWIVTRYSIGERFADLLHNKMKRIRKK